MGNKTSKAYVSVANKYTETVLALVDVEKEYINESDIKVHGQVLANGFGFDYSQKGECNKIGSGFLRIESGCHVKFHLKGPSNTQVYITVLSERGKEFAKCWPKLYPCGVILTEFGQVADAEANTIWDEVPCRQFSQNRDIPRNRTDVHESTETRAKKTPEQSEICCRMDDRVKMFPGTNSTTEEGIDAVKSA